MSTRNVADAILEQLSVWGVKAVYGYIGDDLFYLFDALARHKNIKLYQVKHEEAAALMASTHAKLTGEIGVCVADGGPGTLHLMNGLGDAHIDRVPVLVITGQVSRKDIGTNAKQYVNHQLLMSEITCYTDMLTDPKATVKVLTKAYRNAITKSSVAHISVPMDIFPMPCEEKVSPTAFYLKTSPQSSPEVVQDAVNKMNLAKKPTILVGAGGRSARQQVSTLADKWGAAVITTLAGLGAVDKSHPLYVGGLGHAGSPVSSKLLNETDLCLIVGANWWPTNYIPDHVPAIQIDKKPANIGSNIPDAYGLVGDCVKLLASLLEGISHKDNIDWRQQVEQEIISWTGELEKEKKTSGSPVHPSAIIAALEKTVPGNAIITLDTGDNTVWFGRCFRPSSQRILVSGKWRTMGFGLPAAIAASIAAPGQKVIALVGDGGFTMTMAEFLTAVKYSLPVVVVVLNNHVLAMEQNKMQAGNLIPEGTELYNPDFAQFAQSCGGIGLSVKSADELEETLGQAMKLDKPVVIDINTSAMAPPGTMMPS